MASPVFELSDSYVDKKAALDPGLATSLGVPGHDHEMTDFSPAGHAARHQLDQDTLRTLNSLDTSDPRDRLAAGVLREVLEAAIVAYEAGEPLRSIRVIAGDVESARSVFDQMPTATAHDWGVIAQRMQNFPAAFAGMRESWNLGMERGVVTSKRQVLASAAQLEDFAGVRSGRGFFEEFVAAARAVPGAPVDALNSAALACNAALAESAHFLRSTYLPAAVDQDGCGEERHAIARREFLGMNVDAKEAYEWGWHETMRLDEEIRKCANLIMPGASVDEVKHMLDTDPSRAIHGEEALRDWLQELMDDAMRFLIDGNHFDIDPRIQTVEAMIAPPGGAAAQYYTSPSEDLSRPGRTWYPANGRAMFPKWGEPSTAYHEGVPGHHLQCAQAIINRDNLSRVQRIFFNSGHGEGWALYAERLMDEFGFLENPEFRLGYLYAQAFRASRVVIDLGIHCGFSIPQSSDWHPGEKWNPSLMLEFHTKRSSNDDEFNRSEIDRYLGWPAQAISYKLGERVWMAMRDEAKASKGSAFDLKKWHADSLNLGNLGLDLMVQEMRRFT